MFSSTSVSPAPIKKYKKFGRIPTQALGQPEKSKDLQLEVCEIKTPDLFSISLVKGNGDVVGIDADWGDMEKLTIVKIKCGLILNWNGNNPEHKVCVGDTIVAVNGL